MYIVFINCLPVVYTVQLNFVFILIRYVTYDELAKQSANE